MEMEVIRFTLNQRIQHALLLLCVVILAVTGMELQFHYQSWAQALISLEGGFAARGKIHRSLAVVLMALSGWHFLWVLFTERGHREFLNYLPHLQDFKDVWEVLRYYFGQKTEFPPHGRFTPVQKFQYVAVSGGILIMIATGFLMWFETESMSVFPKWIIDACRMAHGWEATFIFGVLLVWHIYHVHFTPGHFPMSWVWINGRITISHLKEEHPLEYQQLLAEGKISPTETSPAAKLSSAGEGGKN
jgi:cytochrome b subunit of formate dehydrogenase